MPNVAAAAPDGLITPRPPLATRQPLAVLQAGRAMAALLVVLFHATANIFKSPSYGGHAALGGMFMFGHAGVEFFFVLSGFVIFYAHRDDIQRPRRLVPYLWKRFRRIYPLYWIVFALVMAGYFAIPRFGEPVFRAPDVILSNLLLIHFDRDIVIMDVAWTLYHEVLFYAAFAVAIIDRRVGQAVLAAWMVAGAAALVAGTPFPFGFWFSPLHLLFGMGIAVAWFLGRRAAPVPAVLAVLGIGVFLGAGAEEVCLHALPDAVRSLIYGAGAAVALAGLVTLERQGRLRTPAPLRLLGDASYAIYLVHLPAMALLAKLLLHTRAGAVLPHGVVFWLLAGLSVVPGVVVHLVLERRLLGIGRAPVLAHPA